MRSRKVGLTEVRTPSLCVEAKENAYHDNASKLILPVPPAIGYATRGTKLEAFSHGSGEPSVLRYVLYPFHASNGSFQGFQCQCPLSRVRPTDYIIASLSDFSFRYWLQS
jgi:hypothetical protein